MIRNNTVLLNGNVVGLYTDRELNRVMDKLADYYQVDKNEFTVTKVNPYSFV